MKQIVDGTQMKQLDEWTIKNYKMSALVLMERAALAVSNELKKHFDLTKILIVCGSGNNGGDGIAIARMLHLEGYCVEIFLAGNMTSFTEETKRQYEIAKEYGVTFVNKLEVKEYTTIVDAIFGVGLSRTIEGKYQEWIEQINASEIPVLSVDLPSGICARTGQVLGIAVRAKETVTFAYGKTGLYLYPGTVYAGKITIRDVGIYGTVKEPVLALEKEEMEWLVKREEDGNKGTFGKVLVVAGSENMSGAAYFAARASLLVGAGMVRIFTPACNRLILQQLFPEAMLTTYREGEGKESLYQKIEELHRWADVVLVGPGIGQGEQAMHIVDYLMHSDKIDTLVVDADGLNCLSKQEEWLKSKKAQCIFTPHMGEMSRLLKCSITELKKEPRQYLEAFCEKYKVTCVMKDARTWIRTLDGKTYLNLTGNCGMATAGSGDVLAGMLAGLLAQGMKAEKAAPFAVYLHGLAGDFAAKKKGKYSMCASDLLEAIPESMTRKISRREME